ncbi:MAG: polysulfide reductase NrfD [Nitrospirota bacterium]|nr:polysulfide reductase NrfD [Nitrospirota bacterium]MDH5768924.1 polysulfide reductase NrfD [Nitrospirota bacterium]
MKTYTGIIDMDSFKRTLSDLLKGKGGVLMYLSAVGILLGVYAVIKIVIEGHGAVTNTSSLVPWGIQITTYIFFALVSGGCTFVNFFGHIFYKKEYESVSTKVVFLGMLTALTGLGALASELGRVERLYMFVIAPNPSSPMWWMVLWYTLYTLVKIFEFIDTKRGRHSKSLLWATFLVAIVTYSTIAAIFGIAEQRVYYYGAVLPVYFLCVGFLSGSALSAIVAAAAARQTPSLSDMIIKPFRTFLGIGLGLAFFLTFWRLIIGSAAQVEGSEIFEMTMASTVIEDILLALVVPFLLLYFSKGYKGLFASSLIVLVMQFNSRYHLIIGGFKIPVFRAYDIPEVVPYSPSHVEAFIVIATISFVVFFYLLAEKSRLLETFHKKEDA